MLQPVLKWSTAVVAIAIITVAGTVTRVNQITVGFALLIAVLLLSVWGGARLGIAASIVASACLNFFFFPPLYTLTIADPANWVALGAFLISALVASRLVTTARVQAATAEERRRELETLYGLSIDLFTATNRTGALGEAAGRALSLLGATAGGLVVYGESFFDQRVLWWTGETSSEVQDMVAGVGRHKAPVEIPSVFGRDVYVPLAVGGRPSGALVVRGGKASKETLDSVGRLLALAIERERFIEQSAHLEALKESDELKTSILRAVSHDLTTPLTSMAIRIDALRRKTTQHIDIAEDVAAVADDSERLRRRIENLLAMARLEAGRFQPKPEPFPPGDLFRSLRENLPLVFASRQVRLRVDPDCPDLNVDPSLALEIVVNLVENAHRASPPQSEIEVVARKHPLLENHARIEILDRGPGIPGTLADFRESGSERMPATTDVAQRGLGLEIARSFAAASGGSIGLSNRPGGGAVARVDLPAVRVAQEAV